jgi:hypothetical protein
MSNATGCGNGTGGDVTFLWQAPTTATRTFNTVGSGFDSVIQIRNATLAGGCNPAITAAPSQCDDDSGGSNTSLMTRATTAGAYYCITVDGFGTAQGAYNLRIY